MAEAFKDETVMDTELKKYAEERREFFRTMPV
jgi:hypothetical protein